MSNIVLVVAAHPDDEVIGCGGAIARHAEEGDTVHIVFLSDGETSRPGVTQQDIQNREQSAKDAGDILGVKSISFLGLPDNRLDTLSLLDVIQPIEKLISTLHPNIVYTHHSGDLNVDHVITYRAVLTACRPQPNFSVKRILSFQVISSTEWSGPDSLYFSPNFFVDVTAYMSLKMRALALYDKEMRPAPHSRSNDHIKALALHHGYRVGVSAAEAFLLVREVL